MKYFAAILLLLGAQEEKKPSKPNIIFIHADDLGYGDLSCYGQQKFKTPNLDRMAAEGVRFTQYYSGSTVCAPSRYALMTGLHMGHAYIRGNGEIPLRPEDVTVAKLLKGAGYATAVIGKWGLGLPNNSGRPDLQGFDYSFGYLDHKHAHKQYTDHLFRNGERVELDGKEWSNELITKESLGFIDKNKAKPFFLYLAYPNPHAELLVPQDSLDEFKGKFEEKPFVNPTADKTKGYFSQPTPRAAFAAMVTRMDRDIGRLFDRLKALGIDDNTIVFFTSDNGPHKEGGADPEFFDSNGPLRGMKRDLTEGGIRVPMIVRWPGKVPAGTVSEDVRAHWDFLPTVTSLVDGIPFTEGIDGESFAPILLGKPIMARLSPLYWEFFERGFDQALRMGDWKGIRNGLGEPIQLYNLKTDVGEKDNVAGKNPEVVAKIEELMKSARTDSERWVPKKGKK